MKPNKLLKKGKPKNYKKVKNIELYQYEDYLGKS